MVESAATPPSLEDLVARACERFGNISDPDRLEQEKAHFLGKQGALAPWMAALQRADTADKRALGAQLNRAKSAIEGALEARRLVLREEKLKKQLAAERLDVSLPGRGMGQGGLHPLTQTQARIEQLFASMGFTSVEGPEIESEDYNFTLLNTPANHPARSMHDTFYIQDQPEVVLRTHTSPVQVRYMQHHRKMHPQEPMPDLRIIAQGRVYRVDSDATHSPMFHQVEGMWVGREVSFADLKGVLVNFLRAFFDAPDLQVRFRPSYFPFTEPSAEIDLAFVGREQKWLEVAGCGMIHPQVLRNGGIDPDSYCGFTFGAGVERLTMLRHGIRDLRQFFDNDLRFLAQFSQFN